MSWKLIFNLQDGMGNTMNRSFGLATALADVAAAGAAGGEIADLYAAMTDCGVLGGTVSQSIKGGITGNTPTAPAPAGRYWRVGRITVSLTPSTDGQQTLTTFEVPAIKAALVGAGGSIVDDGTISAFLAKFTGAAITEPGRMADGQVVASTSIVSGYVYNKPHPESEA